MTRDVEPLMLCGRAIAPPFVGGKSSANVGERVDGNHAFAHVVCPFQDLGADVD
jgi:hypothetical protein